MPRLPIDAPPPHDCRSDIDGMRHVVVLADEWDLSGWALELADGSVEPFDKATGWRTGSSWNFLGIGDESDAWIAIAPHGVAPVAFHAPDGTRLSLAE